MNDNDGINDSNVQVQTIMSKFKSKGNLEKFFVKKILDEIENERYYERLRK